MDDRGSNQRVMGAVVAVLIVVVFTAYVLVAVVRTGSHDPMENSIGTITGDALPLPATPSLSLVRLLARVARIGAASSAIWSARTCDIGCAQRTPDARNNGRQQPLGRRAKQALDFLRPVFAVSGAL